MFKTRFLLLLVFVLALPLGLAAQAQPGVSLTPPTPPDPNASISWPPPVYLLRGDFEVRGSANLAGMSTHFLEYRPLDEFGNVLPDEDFPWIPATLPNPSAVLDDVLGVWDTTIVPDGLYELRLVINIAGGEPVYFIVAPLRIENEPPPFAVTPTPQIVVPTVAVPVVPTLPPLQPTPTTFDPTPRAEVIVASGNVRSGDSTAYDIVGTVRIGESLRVLAASASGSGWWQVQLPNGRIGWVAPSLVRVTGDTRTLPRVQPPPPPATPTPTFTPTPVSQANLVVTSLTLDPTQPVCAQTFTIIARVQNVGTTPTNSDGNLSLQDVHINTGTVTASTVGAFPILQPGQSFDVVMRLTVSAFYEEDHRITVFIDPEGRIIETNRNDNFGAIQYRLAQGSC
jgi:hypothetical protein